MADKRISELDAMADVANDDLLVMVDVSDAAMAGSGTDKRITFAALVAAMQPYSAPAFSAFAISGQATTLEVGTAISSGNKTFTWSTTNSSNVAANSIAVADTTTSTTLGSGLANDGSESLSIAGVTNSSPDSHVWTVSGTNTHSGSFSRTFTVAWLWKAYAGTSASATLDATAIKALSDYAALTATALRTYSLAAGNYKYVCFPDAFPTPSTWMNGAFNVPLANSGDNAAYSHTDSSGNPYALVSVTNAQGVATDYRVYRSQNVLGGSLSLTVA